MFALRASYERSARDEPFGRDECPAARYGYFAAVKGKHLITLAAGQIITFGHRPKSSLFAKQTTSLTNKCEHGAFFRTVFALILCRAAMYALAYRDRVRALPVRGTVVPCKRGTRYVCFANAICPASPQGAICVHFVCTRYVFAWAPRNTRHPLCAKRRATRIREKCPKGF